MVPSVGLEPTNILTSEASDFADLSTKAICLVEHVGNDLTWP
jgi:hypothetical protein